MKTSAKLAAIALLGLAAAGAAQAQTHGAPQGDKTVNVQGPQGPFADRKMMEPFYQLLRDAHNQGDKADLDAVETKVKAMLPDMFNGGKPVSKAMEDHVLGVAHQALAMGVGNPKMFDSYETFMAAMLGPQ